MLVSVIVPVYNVENYICECVDSLLEQSLKSLEIVLVDDGSIDRSGKICDEYQRKYPNVKTFHKNNGGLMSAWKYGVTHSSGDIIGFVDSDDWVDRDMYERMLQTFLEDEADIVVCGLIKGEYLLNQSRELDGCYNVEELYPRLINDGSFLGRGVIPSRVVKLFKREVVEKSLKYCDDEISLGEDMVMNFSSLMFAKRISFIKDFFPYHYRINPTSITQTVKPQLFDQALKFNNVLWHIALNESKYDFSQQIATDLICNALNIIEGFFYSNANNSQIIQFLKTVINEKRVRDAIKTVDGSKWGLRYKIYLLLYKKKSVVGLFFYGKIIRALRKIKNNI